MNSPKWSPPSPYVVHQVFGMGRSWRHVYVCVCGGGGGKRQMSVLALNGACLWLGGGQRGKFMALILFPTLGPVHPHPPLTPQCSFMQSPGGMSMSPSMRSGNMSPGGHSVRMSPMASGTLHTPRGAGGDSSYGMPSPMQQQQPMTQVHIVLVVHWSLPPCS
jgi:hypothetical protein